MVRISRPICDQWTAGAGGHIGYCAALTWPEDSTPTPVCPKIRALEEGRDPGSCCHHPSKITNDRLEFMSTHHIPVMIDSGAYSVSRKGLTINLDEYIAFCVDMQKRVPHAVFVNLDVIGDGAQSYANWRTMRRAGLKPLPVYHVNTEEKWLQKYLDHTDYVAIGAVANKGSVKRVSLDRIWERYLIDRERKPIAKVHAMGITSFPLLLRYPWFSVDSLTWTVIAMYGHIFQPRRRGGQWDYSGRPLKIAFTEHSKDKSKKGYHYESMTPHGKKVLQRYLRERGFVLGRSEPRYGLLNNRRVRLIGEDKILEPGVSNNYPDRMYLTVDYYVEFLKRAPWPRPFLPKSSTRGFGL